MMGMVPNIYLLKYLSGKGISLPEIQKTAKKYMTIGYNREQKYRFSDGSYSVWGPKQDETGSIWLTSFVVKAFVQASQYIYVDKKNVMQSVRWILRQQGDDGCFQNKGYAIHREIKRDITALSASILITLLEAEQIMEGWKLEDAIPSSYAQDFQVYIEKAYQCVTKNISNSNNQNIYLKSLATYASTLYEKKLNINDNHPEPEHSDALLDSIMSVAHTSLPGKLYWTTGQQNKARDVEITAYNVLSLVLQSKVADALNAIRWVATHRNSYGGFVSTQDTMVALQAISEYSLKINSEENNAQINVTIGNEVRTKTFEINEDNKRLLQKENIGNLGSQSNVTVSATGKGCFMVQTILKYNIQDSPDMQTFNLVIMQNNTNLTACARNDGKKETDMVVIEIELLSGYKPNLKSLQNLLQLEGMERSENGNYALVKKYEYDEIERKIVLYYNEMLKETSCYYIELKSAMEVMEIKPAIATIYDYYNSKNVFSISYSI